MMELNKYWQLPDGVEELMPPLAGAVESLRRKVLDQFESCGYELVTPPMIEYLESLLSGTGNDLDIQTFKVTDQLTGRMMGIRADITPQVARIDAHVLKSEGVRRLCYTGTVLHTKPAHMLTNRCPSQIGCELFGSSSLEADLEILDTMIRSLRAVDIEPLYIDLSHIDLVEGLISQADFTALQLRDVLDAFGRKSIPDLAQLGQDLAGSDTNQAKVVDCLAAIASLGGKDALQHIKPLIKDQFGLCNERVTSALEQLTWIADQMQKRHPKVEIGYDFSELRGYKYHTGIVFAAYTKNHGYAIAQGGRYDAIGAQFGNPRPAVGFSADLKVLSHLTSFRLEPKKRIFAPASDDAALRDIINQLREEAIVVCQLESSDSPESLNCSAALVQQDGLWQVTDL